MIPLDEVLTISGLVSKAPDDYRRMVEVTLNHSPDPLEVSILIICVMSKRLFAIAHSVRLDIRFIYHIKSIFVAERIPERIVRIMTCPYSIDIELLHDHDILDHICLAHHISLIRVHLVAIGALDEDWLSVHEKLSVLYSHIPKAYVHPGHFSETVLVI